MSERPLPQGRFDPAVHDPNAYMHFGDPNPDALRLRQNLVLGSLFTGITELAYERVIEDRAEKGLIIPQKLPGGDPVLKSFDIITQSQFINSFGPDTFIRAGAMLSTYDDATHDVLMLHMPIGDVYGKEFSIALINATRALDDVVPRVMEDAEEIPSGYGQVVQEKTFFSQPVITLLDSLKSTAEAIHFLVGFEPIPGFENDPMGLVQALIDRKTLQALGMHISFGLLGTAIKHGVGLKDALDPETLRLTPRAITNLSAIKGRSRSIGHVASRSTFYGCPVARENTPVPDGNGGSRVVPESGINIAAQMFLPYLRAYYEKPELAHPAYLRRSPNV